MGHAAARYFDVDVANKWALVDQAPPWYPVVDGFPDQSRVPLGRQTRRVWLAVRNRWSRSDKTISREGGRSQLKEETLSVVVCLFSCVFLLSFVLVFGSEEPVLPESELF